MATALHDARATFGTLATLRQVVDCASPLALLPKTRATSGQPAYHQKAVEGYRTPRRWRDIRDPCGPPPGRGLRQPSWPSGA